MIEGSCHCGRIKLKVAGEPGDAIECNCTHCASKGLILTFFGRGQVTVEAAPDDIGTYMFNKHVIQHRFCRTCGCQPYAEGDGPQGPTTAVNLRCFDVDLGTLAIAPFDGRSS